MSSSTFHGMDVSWLAGDAAGHVAWLVTNGSGIVPNQLRADPATTDQQEELLRDWVIQHGRAFCLGVGNTQWTDVAALGIYGFDWDREARHFSLVAAPVAALSIQALPATLQNGAARVTFTHLRFAEIQALTAADVAKTS